MWRARGSGVASSSRSSPGILRRRRGGGGWLLGAVPAPSRPAAPRRLEEARVLRHVERVCSGREGGSASLPLSFHRLPLRTRADGVHGRVGPRPGGGGDEALVERVAREGLCERPVNVRVEAPRLEREHEAHGRDDEVSCLGRLQRGRGGACGERASSGTRGTSGGGPHAPARSCSRRGPGTR